MDPLARATRDSATGCLVWQGAMSEGYGAMKVGGRVVRAHRVSYALHVGPILDGLFVLHRCDNPLCVNPEHLFLGTNTDNMRDCAAKGRHKATVHGQHGERNANHRLTVAEVARIRERYAAGGVLQRELAADFGVTRSQISNITRGNSWASGP